MNINELFSLYTYLENRLAKSDYAVSEMGVLDLYNRIISGKASRKDFLIYGIKDMLLYIEENKMDGIKSTLLFKYKRIYK